MWPGIESTTLSSERLQMDGEGASKKRKFFHGDQEEEDDEQKIELFFALIRNIRGAREHLMNGSDDQLKAIENKRNKKKVEEEEEKKIEVWKPSFQREDFMEEAAAAHQFIKSSHPVSTLVAMGSSQGTMKENTIKEGMDLSLSLSLGPKL